MRKGELHYERGTPIFYSKVRNTQYQRQHILVVDLNAFPCANHGDAERGRRWEGPTGEPAPPTNLRSRYRASRSTTHHEALMPRVFSKSANAFHLFTALPAPGDFGATAPTGDAPGQQRAARGGGYGIPRWIDALLHSNLHSSIRRGGRGCTRTWGPRGRPREFYGGACARKLELALA